MPGVYDMKPPRVRFEMRPAEDRNESIKQGRKVYKNVAWALVNPAGSKDEVERVAEDWISTLRANAMRYGDDNDMANFHRQLLEAVETAYSKWSAGQQMPETGTPIRMCLMFTPAEQQAIINANILTLEELAGCNEQALQLIGLGSRALKDRAATALKTAANSGTVIEENVALKAKLADQEDRIKALEDALKAGGTTPVATMEEGKRRGRPPKIAVNG